MAAVLTPQHHETPTVLRVGRSPLRPVPTATAVGSARREDVPWVAIVAGSLFLFLVLGAFTIVSGRAGVPDPAARGSRPATVSVEPGDRTVVVSAGDTLWSIARSIQPDGDVRPLVDELISLNGTAAIRPGQQVIIPS